MGFRVIRVDESMCWSMPKLNKVIPAGDEAFVMQIHPKRPDRVVHLMGETQADIWLFCFFIKIWHKEIWHIIKYDTLLKNITVIPKLCWRTIKQ